MKRAIRQYSFVTKKLNLLLISSDKDMIELLTKEIKQYFGTIKIASDSAQALNIFQNSDKPIDIIVSDIGNLQTSRTDLLKKIRENNINIPIIVFFTLDDESDFVELLKLGIQTLLPKPIQIDAFLHSIYALSLKIDNEKITNKYVSMLERQLASAKKQLLLQSEELDYFHKKSCQFVGSCETKGCKYNTNASATYHETEENKLMSPSNNSDYFDRISSFDRIDISDAIDDFTNHVTLIKSDGAVDRARLKFAIIELNKALMILKKYDTFEVLADGIAEFTSIISDSFDAVLLEYSGIIIKMIEELAHSLENFVVDIVRNRSEHPNYYDNTILSDITSVLIAIKAKEVDMSQVEEYELF